ncbi:MAG: undecaprenyl/decaprenyl-phosphate alpha-N-acetylglucosaminyl 1-phosphate transferase [Candidatus Schekmanbacteria bacterium]|nr:undecaprenyl/decaprenyl-phosphate alpha-N-acetylglucosaminyl 1-phosphate transferase [Candidatus Schekmanbacteria bacterium]
MTLFIFLFSITVSFVLTPWVRMLAHKMNALDTPSERKIHASPTPLLGGIAIFIACWGAILINSWPDDATKGILWGSLLIFGMGILDDMFQVSAKPKLLIQIIAAIIVVCSGMVITLFPKLSPWGMAANYIITLVWIVGLANALNFFDGMDGLAGGLAGIISLFLFVLACQRTQPVVGRLATALAGATLGFLPYNLKIKQGASIFLGDCGSAMLGFVLAALAVKGEWADNNPVVSLSAPLLIFGVLIFDLFYISIERVASKKVTNFSEWLKYTGKDHLHHRLEALLQSKLKSVLMIYLLSFTLGLGALALRYARTVEAVILIVQAVLILLIISILQIEGTKREKRK